MWLFSLNLSQMPNIQKSKTCSNQYFSINLIGLTLLKMIKQGAKEANMMEGLLGLMTTNYDTF